MVNKKDLESKVKKFDFKKIKKPVLKKHLIKINETTEPAYDYDDFTKLKKILLT